MFQVRSKVAAKLTIIKYSFDPNLWKNMPKWAYYN